MGLTGLTGLTDSQVRGVGVRALRALEASLPPGERVIVARNWGWKRRWRLELGQALQRSLADNV